MTATTTTTTTTTTAKKQFTFGVSENHKNLALEMRGEFTRPAAVKNAPAVPMSEKECFEILYKVATDRRFVTLPIMETVEIDGENVELQSIDDDGNPRFETVDLIAKEWDSIVSRDYSESVSKTPTIAGLVASVRSYGKKLGLAESAIQAMIDAAMATAPAGE
jgi:hypothetical protein